MRLHPAHREQMKALVDHFPFIAGIERSQRRTDWLTGIVAVIAALGLMVFIPYATGIAQGVQIGLLFVTGFLVGVLVMRARIRREAYDTLCELREIAELTLAVADDDEEED